MRPGSTPNHPPRFEALEPRRLFAVDLGGSLVAHWTFEDASGAAVYADVSPDAPDHPATPAGDAALTAQNNANRVLQLDGSGDRFTAPNSSAINLDIQGQRTVAFWFQVDDVDENTRKQMIFEEGGTSRGLNLYVFDGQIYVGGWNLPGGESNWSGTWLGTAGVQSGRWHHVALTLDGGATTEADALRGYLDGREFGRGVGSQLWPHAGSITVGDHTDGTIFHDGVDGASNTNAFAGQLDDGRVYNRTLNAAEVFTLARGPAAAQTNPSAAAPTLATPDLEYTLAPAAQLEVGVQPPPENLNAEQTPDYPARAIIPPTPKSAEADPAPASTESNAADWDDAWYPAEMWDELAAFFDDESQQEPTPQDQATVEVDVQDAPLR